MTRPVLVPAIMSGGAGTRLWPLSRQSKPKQFHRFIGEQAMLPETLARLDGPLAADVQTSLILCNERQEAEVIACLNEAGRNARLILEPAARNTAAAAALASHAARALHPNALVLLLPADHHIENTPAFTTAIDAALPMAADGQIVTFGIEPTGPETAFGYVKRGKTLAAGFALERFVEKPEREQAESYLAEGGYYWNAGIYLFRADVFLKELAAFRPDIAGPVQASFAAGHVEGASFHPDASAWQDVASNSIDYAVGERTSLGAIVPVSMGWSDLGSWNTLHDLAVQDAHGNALQTPSERSAVISIDTTNCLVRADGNRLIALAGCEDLVVIDTPDALFVGHRDRAQLVKQVVERLRAEGRTDLL